MKRKKIIYFTYSRESAVERLREYEEMISILGPVEIRKGPLEIITPTCRIRFRSMQARNDGLRADITIPFDRLYMCHSEYGKEDCTPEEVMKIIKKGYERGL